MAKVKTGTYRLPKETKFQCKRRNAGKPYASRGCLLKKTAKKRSQRKKK